MELKENDVYKLMPNERGEIANWCRENLLIVRKGEGEGLYFVDTYWSIDDLGRSSSTHGKVYTLEEAQERGKLEFYCNLDDIESTKEHKTDYYDDKDVFLLTEQHGIIKNWYLRKGAQKSKEKILSVLDRKINHADERIDSLKNEISWWYKQREKAESGNLDEVVI